MSLKVGDKVIIRKDEKTESYFSKKYTGTEAIIEHIYTNDTVSVICFDGKEFLSHIDYFDKKIQERKIDNSTKKCEHKKKYKNRISARIAFWVCPDCGKDLGDA